jgi:hypothetical protein
VCLLSLTGAPGAALAQQFDTFGDGPLQGFDFGTEGATLPGMPSLGDTGVLPPGGPAIELQIIEGDSDSDSTGGMRVFPGTGSPITSVIQPDTVQASRVTLRALDKMLGRPTDVDMAVGETVMFGRLAIRAVECRYPADDPASDAYAHLEILDPDGRTIFDGWMIASSPALSALEHPRYDVWVLRCTAE